MELNKSEFINNWEKWKATLSNAVDIGHWVGMSDDTIDKLGLKIGNMLSSSIDPENREQRLLQELWKSGDDNDRKTLTKMIVKMVQTEKH